MPEKIGGVPYAKKSMMPPTTHSTQDCLEVVFDQEQIGVCLTE